MATSEKEKFKCYLCGEGKCTADAMLDHFMLYHKGSEKLTIRYRLFDEQSGIMGYRSVHFGITHAELMSKVNDGCIPHISEANKITFKRKLNPEPEENTNTEDRKTQNNECQTDNSELYQCFDDVMEQVNIIERGEDFKGILSGIRSGKLIDNIAFHLLLDVGRFFTLSSINLMRYTKETLNFWVTVKNLFKGKGVSFFRGYKGEGLRQSSESTLCINPNECRVNFIVPSDDILRRESSPFLVDAAQPGILHTSLDSFALNNKGKDVKISIDGKKLAYGFGKLGDEDLCGFEQPPTLKERKERHDSNLATVGSAKKILESLSTDCSSTPTANSVRSTQNLDSMKNALIITIGNLSERIKELRQLIVKRETSLHNLMKQVEGDWKSCKVAPAISYHKTKVLQCQSSIRDLLASVDSIGYIVSCINGTSENYICGQVDVMLNTQSNFMCLRDTNNNEDLDPCYTKQRTGRWYKVRNKSKITGSTLFKALGFESLKQQQQHYDKVMRGITVPISEELQALFEHGEREEINAIATLVAKVIPVFYPQLVFREDGCELLDLNGSSVVISGDGSGINKDRNAEIAFEFKCPRAGKRWVTDVHYSLPVRYTTQVMSQMAAKGCFQFGYLCFTRESSTFITGKLDSVLWADIFQLANTLYGSENVCRPNKLHPNLKELHDRLRTYAKSSAFMAEFPSLTGIKCSCRSLDEFDKDDVFGIHASRNGENEIASDGSFILESQLSLDSALTALNEAYALLRRPAKEILVTVISDLDRTLVSNCVQNYAVPIHYALPGFSLTMSSVRGIIHSVAEEIFQKDMNLKVIAFDGQFLELALADDKSRPLTLCKLMKQFWGKVQSMEKSTKLTALLQMNALPKIENADDLHKVFNVCREGGCLTITLKEGHIRWVPCPVNIKRSILSQEALKSNRSKTQDDADGSNACDDFLSHLPQHIIDQLDPEAISILRGNQNDRDIPEQESDGLDISDINDTSRLDFEEILIGLLISEEGSRFRSVSLVEFENYFKCADSINEAFRVKELRVILSLANLKSTSKMTKVDLVNAVSEMCGIQSKITKSSSPKSLKYLSTSIIKRWNVETINIAYAQVHFMDYMHEWEKENVFRDNTVLEIESGKTFKVHKWYAQPSQIGGRLFQPIIDPHHIFVNNRGRCCSKGMLGMNVRPTAWWKVAENSKINGTGLSLEIAKELRDKQRNAFAQTTFSEKVEKEMKMNGDFSEAKWCRLIRNWYWSIDEASVDICQRIEWLLEIRGHLLQYLKVGHFPPPGAYVAGMPIAQYEGILTNVDRRLQLYSMLSGPYNQRAVTSLDSETLFSAFQEYDPKGCGVLKADDIPVAIGAAVSLYNQRLDQNRLFYMKTNKKERVYPQHALSLPSLEATSDDATLTNVIKIRAHHFDKPERKSKVLRRKSGVISTLGVPGKGADGVRYFHKLNEEKILSHRRFGIQDADLF